MNIQFQSNLKPKAALGCLTLFLLPFFLAGFGIIAAGARKVFRGEKDGWLIIGFGLFFAAFAGGFYWLGIRGTKDSALQAARREQFANEPWKIREDWATGRIRSTNKSGQILAWVFAIFWNAIAWSVVFIIPKELAKGNREVLIALLFPAVGIGLLIWAIRATIRQRKFGETELVLQTIPGAVGGVLAGTLRFQQPLVTMAGVNLRLSCINRVTTGTGKNRSTHNHVRWQEEQTLQKNQDVPVFFRLPPDLPVTDSSQPNNEILWQLEARAETPGVDYFATLDVPVFAVAQPNPPVADPTTAFRESPALYQPPANSRVRFDQFARGGPTFHFPPARNLGAAAGLAIFALIWSGAIWLMIVKGAPVLFPIIFGLFEVLMLVGLAHMLLWGTRVIITPGEVRLESGIGSWRRVRVIPRSEIAEFKLAAGMQAGQRLYHDIKLHLTTGKSVTLASSLPDKREAEWLLDRMCECLAGR
ncbi:MAG: hypothetical protein PCFJNLEI_01795 [Verrucomicrobiae bacterium]|nr:hypothetical protein [Verrucomicrobiae bacterium]